jgi:hypothetical protein
MVSWHGAEKAAGSLWHCHRLHHLTDGTLKLLLLFPVIHHHKCVDCLFPPLHRVMVRAEEAGWVGVWRGDSGR